MTRCTCSENGGRECMTPSSCYPGPEPQKPSTEFLRASSCGHAIERRGRRGPVPRWCPPCKSRARARSYLVAATVVLAALADAESIDLALQVHRLAERISPR